MLLNIIALWKDEYFLIRIFLRQGYGPSELPPMSGCMFFILEERA
jgi:hypothetical protein